MSVLPTPEYSRNMRLIGHSDRGGRPDGVQLMVHRGFAYIGHMVSQGFSIVDVRDPKHPKPAGYMPAPPGTGTFISRRTTISCWSLMRETCSQMPVSLTKRSTTPVR